MTKIKRYANPGNLYFITCVTHQRKCILNEYSELLLRAINRVAIKEECEVIAWVLLPDHFHAIINVQGRDISKIMQKIKLVFSAIYRIIHKNKSGKVWQKRFWDHHIRDQEDLNRHMDYIHYNPVKHGFSNSPFTWKASSIHRYREYYQDDWGVINKHEFEGKYGE